MLGMLQRAYSRNRYLVFVASIMLLAHLGLQQQHKTSVLDTNAARVSDVRASSSSEAETLTESCVRYVSQ